MRGRGCPGQRGCEERTGNGGNLDHRIQWNKVRESQWRLYNADNGAQQAAFPTLTDGVRGPRGQEMSGGCCNNSRSRNAPTKAISERGTPKRQSPKVLTADGAGVDLRGWGGESECEPQRGCGGFGHTGEEQISHSKTVPCSIQEA